MQTEKFTEDIVYQWQKTWSEKNIEELVDHCRTDQVGLPYFLKYLPKDAPTIECGCGLGQWVIYLGRQGFPMEGLEIVPDCIETCKKFYPDVKMKVGDVRDVPYPDGYFGGYISIGVFEHMIEGPEKTISEMARILRPGGVAVITVPALNTFLRFWYPLRKLLVDRVRNSNAVRTLLGKPALTGNAAEFKKKFDEIESQAQPGFWPIIGMDPAKGPMFVEYKCKRGLIEGYLERAGFEMVEVAPVFHPYVFQDTFGSMFFKKASMQHGPHHGNPELNLAGKILNGIFQTISPHFFNYVYLYVARKK